MPGLSVNRIKSLFARADDSSTAATGPYRMPDFTPEVVEAVRRIDTRLSLKADEGSRALFEREANAACAVEYEALAPLFRGLPHIRKVLEIGPGLGRSVVTFTKLNVWPADAEVHLYDTTGTTTKYKQKHYDAPPKWPDVSSFCGDIGLLETVLRFNGVENFRIFDARQQPLTALPGPYDLIYGFYSVGFHWSVEHYLDELLPLLGERGVLVCTLNKHFQPFSRLETLSSRVIASPSLQKGSQPLRFLALSKAPLPETAGESAPGSPELATP